MRVGSLGSLCPLMQLGGACRGRHVGLSSQSGLGASLHEPPQVSTRMHLGWIRGGLGEPVINMGRDVYFDFLNRRLRQRPSKQAAALHTPTNRPSRVPSLTRTHPHLLYLSTWLRVWTYDTTRCYTAAGDLGQLPDFIMPSFHLPHQTPTDIMCNVQPWPISLCTSWVGDVEREVWGGGG